MSQAIIEVQGIEVPALGFGTFQLEGEDCYRMVRAALDIGYRHLDTARFYENEAEVGRALADSGVARGEVFLTTKIWREELEPARLRASAEDALRALGVDAVDLLLIHWPNDALPLAPALEEMAALRDEGKVRALGVSNFNVALVEEALAAGVGPLLCNQVEYHVLLDQSALLEALRSHQMMLTAYSPLARGQVFDEPEIDAIADKHGVTTGQVALAWLLAQPGVAAIPKTSSEARARENFEALRVELEPEDMRRLAALPKDVRTIDPPFAPDWD